MQQNDVPVVKMVHIQNGSDASLHGLCLRITSEPAFADPWEARIALIAEKSDYSLEAVVSKQSISCSHRVIWANLPSGSRGSCGLNSWMARSDFLST
jgi:hypothetical protein